MAEQYYNNVSLLLHFNDSNGSTVFTDNAPAPKTVTANGNAQISSAQTLFGGNSGKFDGTGDFLSVVNHADFNLTSGDWTIETFAYVSSLSADPIVIVDKDGVSGSSYPQYNLSITSTGKLWAFLGNGNGVSPTGLSYQGTTTISTGAWHHLALVKYGALCLGFVDGVLQWSSSAAAMYGGAKPLVIGYATGQPANAAFSGYLKEFRITKGVARYTENFTVPNTPFPHSNQIPFFVTANQGAISVTGQAPAIKAGAKIYPAQGTISVIGQVPKHSSDVFFAKPQEGSISVIGQAPTLRLGWVLTPTEGSVSVIGQVPVLKLGQVLTPTQGAISVIGQIAKHSNDVVFARPQEGGISVIGQVPALKLGQVLTPTQSIISVVGQVSIFADRVLTPIPPVWLATRYRCYLTGAAGLPDLELPISSFQTRINSDSVSYLSCVLRGADSYTDDIALRAAGQLRVFRVYVLSDGAESTYLMANVLLEQMDLSTGGRSGVTAQLSGTGNMVPVTAKSMTLQNPSYFGLSGGKHRYRCELDPRLRPGDTVTINGDTFVVGGITHIVDTSFEMMEIAEA